MHIINKIFLDSSVFIESSKKTNQAFYNAVTSPKTSEGYINDVVCSETWYLFLGLMGGSSPLSLKQRTGIGKVAVDNERFFCFYREYHILPVSFEIVQRAFGLIKHFNLLPNDALILATCIINEIPFLASHDSDFETPCISEGITLLTPLNYQQHFIL